MGFAFDFIRQTVEEPDLLDKIPDGSILGFIEEDFVKKNKENKEKRN